MPGSFRNIVFDGNTFNGIGQVTQNPATLQFDQVSNGSTWIVGTDGHLPFSGKAREVVALVTEGSVLNATGATVFAMPYATTEVGAGQDEISLTWPEPVRGRVHVTVRADRPV